jgi:hypothetical protein
MRDESIPVSSTDELAVAGGRAGDRVRRLGEYKATNTPLSAAEIEQRKHLPHRRKGDWSPRTLENIADIGIES